MTNARVLVLTAMVTALGCNGSAGPEDDEGSTIYALQRGEIEPGTTVRIDDVVVTGTGLVGLWVQDPAGGPYSGLWVELGFEWQAAAPDVVPGAVVDIEGTYLEYDMDGAWPGTVTEIATRAESIVVRASAEMPAPVDVDYAELVDPIRAEPWEAVVVRVRRDVTVVSADTGYGGWSVTDGSAVLELQNSMYRPDPLREGDAFSSLAGVLQYSFGAFKLEPRGPDDVVP